MNEISYKELIAFHPGCYIKDIIDEIGMSQGELAKRLQTSGKYVSDLIHGNINLTGEMALKLSIVFGTSVSMWLNLNQTFIEKKLEIERRMHEDEECRLVKKLDYHFWVALNLVEPVRGLPDKVKELQRYFRVSSLEVLKRRDFLVQYRTAAAKLNDSNVISANAWVQTAINIGIEREVEEFDKKKLRRVIPEIRKMTNRDFGEVSDELQTMLAGCGIALVFLPNLKNCGVTGAVKWLNKEKVVLAINSSSDYAASFWFSLFHELGHVMQQRLKVLIVKEDKNLLEMNELLKHLEEEADTFARDMLVPKKEYDIFIRAKAYSEEDIAAFAQRIEVSQEVVMHRMQMERLDLYGEQLGEIDRAQL